MTCVRSHLEMPRWRRILGYTVAALLCSVGLQGCGGGGAEESNGSSCPATSVTVDLPLAYSILHDGAGLPEHLVIHTDGGLVKMTMSPWGPHGEPHTGHPGRDIKSNWAGLLWHDGSGSLLEELAGDGDMVCETSELCGMRTTLMESRIPTLIAPDSSFVVRKIYLNQTYAPGTYGSLKQWRLEAEMCGYIFQFEHIGWIGEAIRTQMVAQGDSDPSTYAGATGVNLLSNPIPLSRGDSFAFPEVGSVRIDASYPGYVVGKPWAPMEIVTSRSGSWGFEPLFSWLSAALQSELRTLLQRQISEDPTGMYASWRVTEWLYTAEADLWTDTSADPTDYSSILTNLGAWMETGAGADEAMTIWRILKSTPLYNSSLYDSADVSYLILRGKVGDDFYRGEVLTPAVDATSGTVLIKWRMQYVNTYGPTYQKLTYSLNAGARRLKLHWGTEHTLRANAEAEADPDDPELLTCDGSTIICMSHDYVPGIPGY